MDSCKIPVYNLSDSALCKYYCHIFTSPLQYYSIQHNLYHSRKRDCGSVL